MHALLRTRDSVVGLILRLVLAIVIFPHGAQKLLGWFGGGGVDGTLAFLGGLGVPAALAVLIMTAEFLGSLLLLFGFLTRVAAFGIGCVMLGAIFLVHLPNGFFMGDGGYEFHLLALGVIIALLVQGGGLWSVDGWITSAAPNSKAVGKRK